MPLDRRSSNVRVMLLPPALLLLVNAGCAARRPDTAGGAPSPPPATATIGDAAALTAPGGCTPTNPTACRTLYDQANRQAIHPNAAKIRTSLTPLLRSTPGLVWNDAGQILMATWTKESYYSRYKRGDAFPLYGDTWLTAAPAAQQICRRVAPFGPDWLNLRLQQLFGLPPGADKDAFALVWVDPKNIFRPCPDPSIFDRECQVDVPVEGGATPGAGPPWSFCANPDLPQVSAAYDSVTAAHLRWICNNWCTTYCNTTGYPCTCTEPALPTPFPWTALGYTYDWGRPDAPVGLSEYVVPGKTQVVFDSVEPTMAYCSPSRN